jgi:2-haloacid dehalogenase
MTITTCVFDAYGTLFDVSAAARECAMEPGRDNLKKCWQKLANDWRLKQLQYSWIRRITNTHINFWEVTKNGLDYALEANNLANDNELRERLLSLYWSLKAYPEVSSVLKNLQNEKLETVILSNGSVGMLKAAAESAKIDSLLNDIISVDLIEIFKPDFKVYDLVLKQFKRDKSEILFVSSNGWDAAAAAGFGFHAIWVNRNNEPVDKLPWSPEYILSDLSEIPQLTKTI